MKVEQSIDWRGRLADGIAIALGKAWPAATITEHENTSGCPVLRVTVAGQTFNVTITRARK